MPDVWLRVSKTIAEFVYLQLGIVPGGGVVQHAGLHVAVRRKIQVLLNGYIQSPMVLENIEDYIVSPSLGNRSGV